MKYEWLQRSAGPLLKENWRCGSPVEFIKERRVVPRSSPLSIVHGFQRKRSSAHPWCSNAWTKPKSTGPFQYLQCFQSITDTPPSATVLFWRLSTFQWTSKSCYMVTVKTESGVCSSLASSLQGWSLHWRRCMTAALHTGVSVWPTYYSLKTAILFSLISLKVSPSIRGGVLLFNKEEF